MERSDTEFDKLLGGLEDLDLTTVNGRITEVVGMLIKAIVPQVQGLSEIDFFILRSEPDETFFQF